MSEPNGQMSVTSNEEWRSLAACRSADPELFFPISAKGRAAAEIARAKAVCARCRVRSQCLDYALATHQVHGIWGGTTEEERYLLRLSAAGRRAQRGRAGPPGVPASAEPRQGSMRWLSPGQRLT